jgi:hypothetical protein
LEDDITLFVDSHRLECTIDIPNAASELEILVNAYSRNITYSMTLNAPQDKKRNDSKLRWLLKQIKGSPKDNVLIEAIVFGKSKNICKSLGDIVEDNRFLLNECDKDITGFKIIMSPDLGTKFSSRKGFIEVLENGLIDFYKNIGENLKQPVILPPKVIKAA